VSTDTNQDIDFSHHHYVKPRQNDWLPLSIKNGVSEIVIASKEKGLLLIYTSN
jgi:hypothetical protein